MLLYMACNVEGKTFFAAQLRPGFWTWEPRERAYRFSADDTPEAKACKRTFMRMKHGYLKGFIDEDPAKS